MAKLSRDEIRTRLAMAMTEAVKTRKQAGEKLRLPCAWDSAGLAEYEMLVDVVFDRLQTMLTSESAQNEAVEVLGLLGITSA